MIQRNWNYCHPVCRSRWIVCYSQRMVNHFATACAAGVSYPSVEQYRPPSRDEMGPHPAEGAWSRAVSLLMARWSVVLTCYGIALFLLTFAALGSIYMILFARVMQRQDEPLPVPAPTATSAAWARSEMGSAQRARARRGAFWAHTLPRHPEMRAQAAREGFLTTD